MSCFEKGVKAASTLRKH